MPTRREILRGGLGLFALGAVGPFLGSALGAEMEKLQRASGVMGAPGGVPLKATRPLAARYLDPKPIIIDGFRFKSWFEGDDFRDDIPFHSQQNDFPGGEPPAPSEEHDVVVVGGGISGLSTAYRLREFNPVVFELHERFGGNAQGGNIDGALFTLGSAYFISPDPGSALDAFYKDLGLDQVVRVDNSPSPVEIDGMINPDIWAGMGVPKGLLPAYEAYRQLVIRMTKEYPDVPFDQPWMLELDRLSLREHIEREVGLPIPAPLAAAIQAYCYSSFTAGWEEISATLGWNFLAAEEFGRWVLPGGNAWMADRLWERLATLDESDPKHAPHLRAGKRVVDLRVQPDGRSLVSWVEQDGSFASMLAREVVMACPKNIARHVIHNLEQDEPTRYNAMREARRAYLVANIIVDRPIPAEFYDIFLLDQPEGFPMNGAQAEQFWRFTDVLDGSFTPRPGPGGIPASPQVLTLYWPLPFESARFTIIFDDALMNYAQALTDRLHQTLQLVGLPDSSVREIRFTRWGHAMPLARVGFLSDGIPGIIRAPYRESVHFVNQDDWALPAIENSLLDAFEVADRVRGRLA